MIYLYIDVSTVNKTFVVSKQINNFLLFNFTFHSFVNSFVYLINVAVTMFIISLIIIRNRKLLNRCSISLRTKESLSNV